MTMKLASFSQTDEPKAFMSPGAHKGVVGCVVTCGHEVREHRRPENNPRTGCGIFKQHCLDLWKAGAAPFDKSRPCFVPEPAESQLIHSCSRKLCQEQNESEIVRRALSLQSVPIFSFAY